ncbi:MAG: hypothetical protein IPM96_13965 [Ignavibacteria bacterium]|nr:hypothetical protein [Ignavibacteria bacterium]
MKKIFTNKIIFLFILTAGMLYAAVTLQYFTARDNAGGVVVEWKRVTRQVL